VAHARTIERQHAETALAGEVVQQACLETRTRPAVVIEQGPAAGIAVIIPRDAASMSGIPEARRFRGREILQEIQRGRMIAHARQPA
jgi:hypothetical protein